MTRTELSLRAPHSEDVTQQPNQEYAGTTSALDRIGSGNTAIEMFEESRSAAGPEIDRLPRIEEDPRRSVRRHNHDRGKFEALL